MLLPSAFSCDSSQQQPPLTRLQSALLASPPASPPQISTQAAVGNIFSACRSLQSLLGSSSSSALPSLAGPPPALMGDMSEPTTPPNNSSHERQLPTPPMAHAPLPMKLRLRSRKNEGTSFTGSANGGPARKRIVKRMAPTRGINKRRRALDDDMGRGEQDDGAESDQEVGFPDRNIDVRDKENDDPIDGDFGHRPLTPKRARIAPEALPLGLGRSDYHELHTADGLLEDDNQIRGTDVVLEADGEPWSLEDDRILVELVLEKLKLTKSDWQDCARSLGKDRGSVGRRWKSLMINGDVGLKRSSRRSRIHGTWR